MNLRVELRDQLGRELFIQFARDIAVAFATVQQVGSHVDQVFQYHIVGNPAVTYLFSSNENKDKVAANPAKFAPQYGGYCAYGAAVNKKFVADPLVYKIVDSKLYLSTAVEKRVKMAVSFFRAQKLRCRLGEVPPCSRVKGRPRLYAAWRSAPLTRLRGKYATPWSEVPQFGTFDHGNNRA